METGIEGVQIESKDALLKTSRQRRVRGVLEKGSSLALAARVLRACGVETGIRVVTQSRVPEGAGLGASSALALAIAAAVARATGQELDPGAIQGPGVAPEHHTALHGGLLALHPRGQQRQRGEAADNRPSARGGMDDPYVDAGQAGAPPTDGAMRRGPRPPGVGPTSRRACAKPGQTGRFDEVVEITRGI